MPSKRVNHEDEVDHFLTGEEAALAAKHLGYLFHPVSDRKLLLPVIVRVLVVERKVAIIVEGNTGNVEHLQKEDDAVHCQYIIFEQPSSELCPSVHFQ